jgi:crotonobetainyl-CoA:carnitine CoA-transferase CaiB-like acyl-CoA transferase
MQANPAPLAGIRVLDIATFVAAPFAAAALGEFGAEVIKVEQPGVGDSLRRLGTYSEAGDTYWWLSDARNKKCITLDFHTARGVELFKQMVAQSDVVVENFRPGTLEKWGIGYEDLRKVNEGLVMLRVSAYGQTGPKRNEPGFARIAHAFSGLTYLVGTADTPPLAPGSNTLADFLTGIYGAYGILLALRGKEKTGRGQYVDIGLYEPMFRFLDEMAPLYDKTGFVKERVGTGGGHAVPHNHYPTGDGKWVAIACTNDKMFARLAEVMGRPELAAEGDGVDGELAAGGGVAALPGRRRTLRPHQQHCGHLRRSPVRRPGQPPQGRGRAGGAAHRPQRRAAPFGNTRRRAAPRPRPGGRQRDGLSGSAGNRQGRAGAAQGRGGGLGVTPHGRR